ncbi:transcription elongation factor B polypeptide 3 [Ceratina calcarata]|uniref:Transcription elongation factor B polypeptide 3 n=1 Tax=Ceratina calcarata TaxID=156304 RepID=A0AAJ7J8Q2_9HYME|nr:transcription elongation factor B polypeptide 3 [Ceratina calcarata]
MSIVDKIKHYQRNIDKCDDNEDRILHCISKLSNLPVTVQHLQETGVGRTVNALRKYDGGVGDAAKALVAKWKAMVASEDTSEGEDEDEACVPDAPESYSDGHESPRLEETSIYKTEGSGKQGHKEKTEVSHGSHNKYVSKHESKVKISIKFPVEFPSKTNDDIAKSSTSDSEKQKKHEKSKHSHKHESRSEKKSSKDAKSASKKDEARGSKYHRDSKSDNVEKSSIKPADNNVEKNNRKRKHDESNAEKKESKRKKNSDSESDEGRITSSEKHNSSTMLNMIKIKEEPQDKDVSSKSEIKQEKKDFHEKLKSSSSKHRADSSNSKSKDIDKKHKHKSETHSSHSKDEAKRIDQNSNKESSESKHQNSSSGSDKHHDKTKDRSKKKDRDEKNKSESKSSKDSKHSKHKSKESKDLTKIKQEINGDEGIDCHSGASFAEALGMCTITQPSKKRIINSPNTSTAKVIKTEQPTTTNNKNVAVKSEQSDDLQTPSLLSSNVKLQPLNVDLASTLPEISPNYKPLPYVNQKEDKYRKEEDRSLTDVMYVKNQRTKVYSGNKSGYTTVPTLFEICTRVLIENIDALEFTGGVPYDIIKPVLERATADQLFMLEHYNPYLIEDTDELWQYHCNREFRNKQREEMETWREMYMRCLDEREAKLKTLTANIKQSIDKSLPVRSTKLAYVDNVVKPPRNILKKQAKYGTANSVPHTASSLKKKLISGGGPTAATNISVPAPVQISRAKPMKKTKAPLMAKALQLIKGRYKR